jgi:thioredoxin
MKWLRVIAVAGMLAVALLGTSCSDDPGVSISSGEHSSRIASVESEEHWQQILSESDQNLLLAEFYADWCAPCRKLAPILESLAERYNGRVRFYRIDVDAHRQLSRNYKVRGIPFTVLIFDREVVDALFGLQPAASYRNSIEKQLDRLNG